MKNIFLFIISLFASFSFFGQSQMLNGISIDGPRGFEKSAELTWTKGNDVVNVMSIKGFLSQDDYEAECKKGSRTTEYLGSEKIEINGDGSHVRCFLSVQDFAEAIFLLVKKRKTGIFNIGNSNPTPLMNYIEAIEKCLKKELASYK